MAADPRTPTPAVVPASLPSTGAGAGTLADAIARWRANHPDFVYVLPCMEPVAPSTEAQQHAARARRLRIPLDEYLEHIYAEQRYCTAHQDWHHVSAFSDAATNVTRACKSWRNERERAAPYRQKRRSA